MSGIEFKLLGRLKLVLDLTNWLKRRSLFLSAMLLACGFSTAAQAFTTLYILLFAISRDLHLEYNFSSMFCIRSLSKRSSWFLVWSSSTQNLQYPHKLIQKVNCIVKTICIWFAQCEVRSAWINEGPQTLFAAVNQAWRTAEGMAEPIRVDSGAVLDMKLIQSIQIRGSQLGGSFDGNLEI